MEAEYWTPEDFIDGACAAADIGKEKQPVFDEVSIDLAAPSDSDSDEDETPRRRGRPPNTAARARSVQESLRLAFHGLGGVEGLIRWGRSHPTEFYRLCGRLIPQEIKGAFDVRQVTLIHALAPTALDMHPDETGALALPRIAEAPQTSRLLSTNVESDRKSE